MKYTVFAIIRRLSDEEPDPLENEESGVEPSSSSGWAPWGPDTIQDVYNVISDKLTEKQREIIEAHLMGYNHKDLAVTEKYWRYWYTSAVNKIRKELNV
jgi:hypothetical protein